jgi:hypothetical protein
MTMYASMATTSSGAKMMSSNNIHFWKWSKTCWLSFMIFINNSLFCSVTMR